MSRLLKLLAGMLRKMRGKMDIGINGSKGDIKTITLKRYMTSKYGTVGRMYLSEAGGDYLHTLECPWIYNIPYSSCIPEGIYTIVPTVSNGLYLVGMSVVISSDDLVVNVATRFSCKIHPANTVEELKGCIAVGIEAYATDFRPSGIITTLVDSRAAYDKLVEYIDNKPTVLRIFSSY